MDKPDNSIYTGSIEYIVFLDSISDRQLLNIDLYNDI